MAPHSDPLCSFQWATKCSSLTVRLCSSAHERLTAGFSVGFFLFPRSWLLHRHQTECKHAKQCFVFLQNQFIAISVSYSEAEQRNMIVFIIFVQTTRRFYAPFLIKSIKDIFPRNSQQWVLLALGWFLSQIQQEAGWLFLLAQSGSNFFFTMKTNVS